MSWFKPASARKTATKPAHKYDSNNDNNNTHTRSRCAPARLSGFCRALKLSPPQQVAVALGLSRSANAAVAREGVKFLVARVPGLVGAGGGQLSLEALHSLLELVNSNEEVSEQVREELGVGGGSGEMACRRNDGSRNVEQEGVLSASWAVFPRQPSTVRGSKTIVLRVFLDL